MGIYKSEGGMDSFGEFVTTTASTSFGNMGFSSAVCSKMPIDWQHEDFVYIHMQCQNTTVISEILSSGMMLDKEFPGGNMDAVHDCYIEPKDDLKLKSEEMIQFRKRNFDKLFMKECEGK